MLYDFYDQRIPAEVTSARHFDTWWKKARAASPGLLTLPPGELTGPVASGVRPSDYPGEWGPFPLSYEFAPGDARDGVTVDIPLATLNQVRGETFAWQVPGLREELVTELIRILPKQLRVNFVPAPDVARSVLARLDPADGDLLDALGAELTRLRGVPVPRDAFDPGKLPAHLRVTFRVLDGGKVLAEGKDLDALRRQVRPQLQATLAEAARGLTRSGLRCWDIGTLPREFSDGRVRAYPALADAGDSVDVRLFSTEAEAARSMRLGTRRLLLLEVPSGARSIASNLPVTDKLALSRSPYAGAAALLDDCAAAAADEIIDAAGGPAWDAGGFARLTEAARSGLNAACRQVIADTALVLAEAHDVEAVLAGAAAHAAEPAFADIRAQFTALVYAGFVSAAGARRLRDLIRYLQAIRQRLDKMGAEPGPGRRADGDRAPRHRRVHCRGPGTPARTPGQPGGPGRPLDDRGAAGQPVRADPGDARAGVGETHPQRAGPAGPLTRRDARDRSSSSADTANTAPQTASRPYRSNASSWIPL